MTSGATTPAAEAARTPTGGRAPARRQSDRAHGSVPWWAPWLVLEYLIAIAIILWQVTDRGLALYVVLAVVVDAVAVYVWTLIVAGRRNALDNLVTIIVTAFFGIAMVPLVSLLWTVIDNGINRFDLTFFTTDMRNVTGEGGGGLHAIAGTIIITLFAVVAAVPIGILAAVYLHEYGRGWLKRSLTFFVDVMTGIPSIVAGLFAFSLFSVFFGPGIRLGIMGSLALMVLMIPIVVRSTEEMLKLVPDGLREAAYALGVPKWRMIVKVVLPTALGGIVTGLMLAVARVIGETAPLLVTTGFVSTVNLNPFAGRMNNLPVFSYYSYTAPGVPPEPYIDRAWTAALILVLMVLILYIGARLVAWRFGTISERR